MQIIRTFRVALRRFSSRYATVLIGSLATAMWLPAQQAPEPNAPPEATAPPAPNVPAQPQGGFKPLHEAARDAQKRDDATSYNGPGAPSPMGNVPVGEAPRTLRLAPGTYVVVRLNQPLSSDHNRSGDTFSATLARPVVVNGLVVAQPGQTVGGRVSQAQKAGRVEGVSRLAVQLTDLTLADGQQVPVQTQFISQAGPTSAGRDVAAVAGTTALGAAAGAAADWGRGAGIGAAAGAVVGTVGVLLTRGHPSVLYPEQLLTFRLEAPVLISTELAPQAFLPVDSTTYERSTYPAEPAQPPPPAHPVGCSYGCWPPPAPYYYYYLGPHFDEPYYYYAPYYPPFRPYYFGPGFYFYYGPRFYPGYRGYYHGRFYGGRGFYHR